MAWELPDTSKGWGAAAVLLLGLLWHWITDRTDGKKSRETKLNALTDQIKAAVYAGDYDRVALLRRRLLKLKDRR